jgi:hypothetical protein
VFVRVTSEYVLRVQFLQFPLLAGFTRKTVSLVSVLPPLRAFECIFDDFAQWPFASSATTSPSPPETHRHGCKSPSLRFPLRRTCIDHYHHQHFLVYVNSCYLVGHSLLPAWKRQNMRHKTLHTVTCYPPFPSERRARHRLVQNAGSRSNSEAASLHPESPRPLPSTPARSYTR